MTAVAVHHLELGPGTTRGSFDRELEPVLTVDSGDSVTCRLLDGDWLTESITGPPARHGVGVPWRRPLLDDGHAMVGPIAVRGARPGMTLRIGIDEVVPADWGWSRSGGRPVEHDRELGIDDDGVHYLRWDLVSADGAATSNEGHRVRMRPFLGLIGLAPGEPGRHSTHPPRRTGGNIDCRELVAGSELYLPVEVEGAFLFLGDGHAAQGDGEVGGTAIECPMDRVRVTVELLPELSIPGPRARTEEGWVVFGFAPTLDEAAFAALRGMGTLMSELYGFGRKEAMNLAGAVVDLRVTQLVNGVKGVHAVLPHDALQGSAVKAVRRSAVAGVRAL